jgi:hypothetical protein
MAGNAVTISIGADISDLVAKLALSKRELSAATAEMNRLAKEVIAGGEGAAAARDKLTDYAAKVASAQSYVGSLSGSLKKAQADAKDFGQAAGLAGWQMQQLGTQGLDAAQSLALGMPPLQVLLQQGPQILGVLQTVQGGVGAAVGSLGSKMLGVLSPANLVIGAFGALGVAGVANLIRVQAEASAAKTAVQSLAGAIAAAGNAGGFQSLTKDIEDFFRIAGPAAQDRNGIYAFGRPLFGARDTLNVSELQEYGARVGQIKGSSRELLLDFGRLAIEMKNAFPSEFKDRADTVVKALEDPDKAAKALMETMNNLSAAERARVELVLRDGDLGDKRAEALTLVAEKMRQERSATILSAEAQRVKEKFGGDLTNGIHRMVAEQENLLRSGERLSPMEGFLTAEFTKQVRAVNNLDDAFRSLADSMREIPQTIDGAIQKAAGLADRLGTLPGRLEEVERNLRGLRGGVGAAPVAAATSERDLLIRTVYGEAGAEGVEGQAAVASVIRNRLQSGRFGGSLSGVITAPGQFNGSPTDDRYGGRARALQAGSAEYEAIGRIVDEVLAGQRPDPTGGALNFYNPDLAAPAWGEAMSGKTRIGGHVFGTAGARFNPQAAPLPGQTPEQFAKTTAAIKEQEDARQRLLDKQAGGAAPQQAEYEIAKRNAEGKKNELKDEQQRLAALQQQRDVTNDLEEKNRLQLDIDRKQADIGEKKLALQRAENAAEIARVGASDPQKKRNLVVEQAERDRSRFEPGTEGFLAANARIEAADRELAQTRASIARSSAETRFGVARDALQREEQAIRQAAADGKLTEAQKVSALQSVIARREQLELQHQSWLQQNVYQNDAAAFSAAEDRKTAILAKSAAERRQLEAASRRDIEQQYRQSYGQIGDSIAGTITGVLAGTTTLRDGMRGILLQLVQQFLASRIRIVTDWLAGVTAQVAATTAGETTKTAAVAAGTAARTGLETSAAATSGLSIVSGILKSIFASAAQVFAGIFGFLSPVMGPAAVGPALAGQATVLGVASALPSFDVGSWELSSDMIAKVHKGEMIVPAGPAAAWRSALDRGPVGAGGAGVAVNPSINVTIPAMDGQSVRKFFKSHGREMSRTISEGVRLGAHLGSRRLRDT